MVYHTTTHTGPQLFHLTYGFVHVADDFGVVGREMDERHVELRFNWRITIRNIVGQKIGVVQSIQSTKYVFPPR